jgi:hypothetical protein
MSSSETRSEPYQCRVLLFDENPSHRASSARAEEPSTVCIDPREGGSIMQEAVLSPLATWQNFYVIIGSLLRR